MATQASFLPDIVEFSEAQANLGKHIIIASLDGTFQRKAFGRVCELVPLAEEIVKLTAVCTGCAKPAAFSRRIVDDTDVELIGGADKYIAVCRSCFFAPDLGLEEEQSCGSVVSSGQLIAGEAEKDLQLKQQALCSDSREAVAALRKLSALAISPGGSPAASPPLTPVQL
eukprot:SAG11_NODE_10867_length_800_cov_1.032810_1_plen_169_part_10